MAMDLTPIDILHVQFKRGLRGYNPAQVDDFIHNVAAKMEELVRDKAELREQVDRLSGEVNRCREIETTMHSALVLAQKTADEVKANAHHEAGIILREAQQKSAQHSSDAHDELAGLKSQIASLREDRDRFEADFRALVSSCSEWLDRQSAKQGESAGEHS